MRISMTLGARIATVFVIVTVIALISSVVIINGNTSIETHVGELTGSIIRLNAQSNIRIALLEGTWALARWQNPWLPLERYDTEFERMDKAMAKANESFGIYDKLEKPPEEQELYNKFKEAIGVLMGIDGKLYALAKESRGKPEAAKAISDMVITSDRYKEMDATLETIEKIHTYIDRICNEDLEEVVQHSMSATRFSIIFGCILMCICLGFSVVFPRTIANIMRHITEVLRIDADNVTTHTKELAISSHTLAAGANTQAAAIEEIAASVEEIASMVKQNADNAEEANRLVEAARTAVDNTQKSMQRSLQANEEISKASSETAKIIKTIDEIAFQTNLLSLNAAVEAARAGEAGAGFAVVASEVRGLSQRSAEAAKQTSAMIEETITKVREGVDIFKETGKSIDEVVDHVHKVSQLVLEVAKASGEQSKGLSQIGRGITDIENVVQQNAASSEENAAASNELHAQAAEIMTSVYMLEEYVFGPESIPQA